MNSPKLNPYAEIGVLVLNLIVGNCINVELGSREIKAEDIFFDDILNRAKSGLINEE